MCATFVEYLDGVYVDALKVPKMAGRLINEKVSQRNQSVDNVTDPEFERHGFLLRTHASLKKLLTEQLCIKFIENKFIFEWEIGNGEVTPLMLTDSHTWLIGITDFERTFPNYCISIALFVNHNQEIGIIYSSMSKQLFSARKGKGALLDGKKITVSDKTQLSEAIIMWNFENCDWIAGKKECVLKNQRILLKEVKSIRAMGSGVLNMAMVACGAAEAYFEMGNYIYWDMAVGELIVTEAGGVIMDPAGGEVDRLSRRILVAGTRELARELAGRLAQYYFPSNWIS